MKRIKTPIHAWLPLHKDRNFSFDPKMPYSYQACLENFLSDLDTAIKMLYGDEIEIQASISKAPSNIKKIIHDLNSNPYGLNDNDYNYIKIKCMCHIDWEQLLELNDHKIDKSAVPGIAACSVADTLTNCMLVSEIAYPSIFNFKKGITLYKQRVFNYIDNSAGFYRECLFSDEGAWPNITSIPLEEVSSWIGTVGLFESYCATTPIQRGLASLTQIIGEHNSSEENALFWAMQGLEAIYCRGKSELRGQLTEKIRLFLGDWPDPKNIIGKLYDFRSKFVHGAFNVSRWNNGHAPYDKQEIDDTDELYRSNALAQRLLLATIQKCIIDKIQSLEFNYTMKVN